MILRNLTGPALLAAYLQRAKDDPGVDKRAERYLAAIEDSQTIAQKLAACGYVPGEGGLRAATLAADSTYEECDRRVRSMGSPAGSSAAAPGCVTTAPTTPSTRPTSELPPGSTRTRPSLQSSGANEDHSSSVG